MGRIGLYAAFYFKQSHHHMCAATSFERFIVNRLFKGTIKITQRRLSIELASFCLKVRVLCTKLSRSAWFGHSDCHISKRLFLSRKLVRLNTLQIAVGRLFVLQLISIHKPLSIRDLLLSKERNEIDKLIKHVSL